MRQLEQRGRIFKWTGLVLLLLIGTAWGTSHLFYLRYKFNSRVVILNYGDLAFGSIDVRQGWRVNRNGRGSSMYHRTVWPWSGNGLVGLPLWIPFTILAAPTAVLWWRDRRIPPGHCQQCGYDLTGNVSGVCPECGTAVPDQRGKP